MGDKEVSIRKCAWPRQFRQFARFPADCPLAFPCGRIFASAAARDLNEAARDGGARGDGFRGDVHHRDFPGFLGSELVGPSYLSIARRGAEARQPIRRLPNPVCSSCTTRKQFVSTRATTSPDPCQSTLRTTALCPASIQSAPGKNAPSPVSHAGARPSFARSNGSGRAAVPLKISSAGKTKSSNVTIVETGFPGNPKTGLPPHFPNTAGLPGRIVYAIKIIFLRRARLERLRRDHTFPRRRRRKARARLISILLRCAASTRRLRRAHSRAKRLPLPPILLAPRAKNYFRCESARGREFPSALITSSPVERIPIRGRAQTSGRTHPTCAARESST